MPVKYLLDASITRRKLHPGEKIRLEIESLENDNADKKQKAIERLKQISCTSRLGLYKESITREDAHDKKINASGTSGN